MQSRSDRVSIYSGLTASHASALLTRQIDMFIGVNEFASDTSFERWPILSKPYILATPKSVRRIGTAGDLAHLAASKSLARYLGRSRTGEEIERNLRRLGIDAPRGAEFDSLHGVAAMVRQDGWAVTTPFCMYEAGLPSDVSYLPLPVATFSRTLVLISRGRELGTLLKQTAAMRRGLLVPFTLERRDHATT